MSICDTREHHYCVFQKHANSEVQKPPSQLSFSLPSIIIPITSNDLESQKYTASYPGQFALSQLPEEAWNRGDSPRRIFQTSLTGDVSSEIAEDDWERG